MTISPGTIRGNAKSNEESSKDARTATVRRIAELTAIIRADVGALVDAIGRPKRLQDLPEEVRLALAEVDVDPTSGVIRRAQFKDKITASEEFLRLCGKDKDPEVIALIRAARRAQQRNAAVLKAMMEMSDADMPLGKLN